MSDIDGIEWKIRYFVIQSQSCILLYIRSTITHIHVFPKYYLLWNLLCTKLHVASRSDAH